MKKWNITGMCQRDDIIPMLLKNRGLDSKKKIEEFLHPSEPHTLPPDAVGIDRRALKKALARIQEAINDHESIVVYTDYDADGVTAGAIMWEALYALGARVMPYIPHRVDEGYGLSKKGIDTVNEQYHPTLIITVDHGITAREKVAYAKSLGIDVIVTDHHVKPEKLPDCLVVHTTKLSGAGISWFVAKEILSTCSTPGVEPGELLALATIGTIADMVPLVGPNRSIAKYGLAGINATKRVGLEALITDAGLMKGNIGTYEISHILAPRLNAMGRLVHAMDALRLLCTKQKEKAMILAQKLGLTNKERQQLTIETTHHALQGVPSFYRKRGDALRKLIFVSHASYNQGVIGLVAGKLVEEFYRPAIVVSKGDAISKASARSISGFNIVEAIRTCSDILVAVGGHPMAAGFTIETQYLSVLRERLEKFANESLSSEKLERTLRVDAEIPLEAVTEDLWKAIREFEPFGFGNLEPVFATRDVTVDDVRLVGSDGKHLKLKISNTMEAIGFGLGTVYGELKPGTSVDIVYTIDMNTWNGSRRLQLKLKDIHLQ
ncbi:single-stranded-DNA-specific exonuclease RecJ [Candidatus Gottesmanbacteria bacterium]|nr:single-stranded-DNA-specific exonuclease RecJ [Candidatus Gottesmanbacteria bacterium]